MFASLRSSTDHKINYSLHTAHKVISKGTLSMVKKSSNANSQTVTGFCFNLGCLFTGGCQVYVLSILGKSEISSANTLGLSNSHHHICKPPIDKIQELLCSQVVHSHVWIWWDIMPLSSLENDAMILNSSDFNMVVRAKHLCFALYQIF